MSTRALPRLQLSHFEQTTALGRLPDALLMWVRQRLCGLRGHETYRRWERNRLFLECVRCGYCTPGWQLGRPMQLLKSETLDGRIVRQTLESSNAAA